MVERITTVVITVSSTLLFGYWLRCAILLLRRQDTPAEEFSTPAPEGVLFHPNARIS